MGEHSVRRAFVTGASGFVGSHVVRALLETGVQVTALVRPGSGEALAGLPVVPVTGDLLAVDRWAGALAGHDTLFHVAALYSAGPGEEQAMYAANVGATQRLYAAAAAAGLARVVHTSTVGTVGRPADGSLPDEEAPFNLWPVASDYVRSKWLGEAVALWWNRRGLPVVVVHPTAPVGPGDRKPTATGQRFVDFLAGRPPDYPAGGMNCCPVADVAQGHLLAARRGQQGRRYILGHRAGNLDEAAFLALLARASGLALPPPTTRPAGRRPLSLTANPGRAIRELGLPQSDLEAAFALEVAFYRRRERSQVGRI
jgi:dihydroflavonol-4-reductase